MNKSKIAAQLYSFRDFIKTPEDVEDTFHKLHDMGYEAVQLSSSLAPMPEEQLANLLKKYGLVPCSSHEQAARIVNETEDVIAHLKKLGVTHAAYPAPHLSPNTRKEVIRLAKTLNDRAVQFAEAGIELAYHNHSAEFVKFDGRLFLELIYENAPCLKSELDTYWIQHGGCCPVEWILRMKNRMQVLHIKDFAKIRKDPEAFWNVESVMAPVGDGNLNWKDIFKAADESGVEWYVVEHDGNCPDPFESFGRSMKYLTEHFFQ